MKSFLKETIKVLEQFGKKPEDVVWVGNDTISFSWDEFCKIADFEYDEGYGTQEIKDTLFVVGDNWWLERYEYDGSECWVFKTLPERPFYKSPVKNDLLVKNYLFSEG